MASRWPHDGYCKFLILCNRWAVPGPLHYILQIDKILFPLAPPARAKIMEKTSSHRVAIVWASCGNREAIVWASPCVTQLRYGSRATASQPITSANRISFNAAISTCRVWMGVGMVLWNRHVGTFAMARCKTAAPWHLFTKKDHAFLRTQECKHFLHSPNMDTRIAPAVLAVLKENCTRYFNTFSSPPLQYDHPLQPGVSHNGLSCSVHCC